MKKLALVLSVVLIIATHVDARHVTANAAAADITPPIEMKYTLGGYGNRMNKPAEGIHDPIMAKALALKKGTKSISSLQSIFSGCLPILKPIY